MLPSPKYQDPAFGEVGETLLSLAKSLVGQTQDDIITQILRTHQRDQEVLSSELVCSFLPLIVTQVLNSFDIWISLCDSVDRKVVDELHDLNIAYERLKAIYFRQGSFQGLRTRLDGDLL